MGSAWLMAVGALVASGPWGSSAAGGRVGHVRHLPSAAALPSGAVEAAGGQPLAAASGAAALAGQLTAVEDTIRDPAASGRLLVTAGRLEQLDYRALVSHPAEVPRVLAALPRALRPVAGTLVEAGAELAGLVSASPAPFQPPAWRIVAPPALARLTADYRAAGRATGVPWPYLAAVNLVETDMGRIQGASSAGAQGPMQFLPATWALYGDGGNIDDPRDAIWAAARLLAAYGAPAHMATALSHYNPDDRYVRAVMDYAAVIGQEPLALRGLYHWRVFFRTALGDVLLPRGYVG